MRVFDKAFDEFMEFCPDGLYVISRRAFTKDEAKKLYDKEYKANISLDEIKEGWVRWQPTPLELRDEICGDFCWLTCEENERGAQPVWLLQE